LTIHLTPASFSACQKANTLPFHNGQTGRNEREWKGQSTTLDSLHDDFFNAMTVSFKPRASILKGGWLLPSIYLLESHNPASGSKIRPRNATQEILKNIHIDDNTFSTSDIQYSVFNV
jgi:hypothetical protein